MSLSIHGNISALNALSKKQATSAHNIANSETDKFKKSRTLIGEERNGAITAKNQQINTPGTMTQQPDETMKERSNVDLTEEVLSLKPTRNAYEANLKALKTMTEMEDSVIDLIG